MIYILIGLAFFLGVMVGVILHTGFAEGYFFPSDRRTMHVLLDKHLTDIAKSKVESKKPPVSRRR